MVNIFFLPNITAAFEQLDSNLKLEESERDLSVIDTTIQDLKTAFFDHKEEFILDIALHPEKRKIYRSLGGKIRKLDPNAFKEIQQVLREIQHKAKTKADVIIACKNYDMKLEEYEELMMEFGGELNKEITDENKYPDGLTPLRKAVKLNHVKFAKVLKELGANVNLIDSLGWSPLKWAVQQNLPLMVKTLTALGANPNLCNDNGWTPLKLAIAENNPEMVKLLKKYGADFNYCVNEATTPLELAIETNSSDMVQLLVRLGADINFRNPIVGGTPLIYAVHKQVRGIIPLLVELGAQINFRDQYNLSPLEFAINHNDPQSVRILSKFRASLNLPNSLGQPPLACALMKGNFAVASELQSLGVDQAFNARIKRNVELAHIWGVQGNLHLRHLENTIELSLEGMYNYSGMKLLKDLSDDFFNHFPEISRTHLSQRKLNIIQEAISRSYPLIRESNENIVRAIQLGHPFICSAGTENHAISLVFCKGKLIVCNRGEGRESLACQIFDLPQAKLTPELIANCKLLYSDTLAFKNMLDDLQLTLEGGYRQKDHKVGNCTWAVAKAAFGALLRQYANNEKQGKQIYKLFTAYARKKALLDYLEQIRPPDYKLLRLIYKKIESKRGFKDIKLLVSDVIKKHKLDAFAKKYLFQTLSNRKRPRTINNY